ncbi:hypothetical protein W97_03540 [Coniosporium apollinis CBS 100218]|uniref:Rhodopsin domain-containing protein n=1 Tax=Coniosporium apollinis (strain CBS 100218) TaxID=1168221 RepID=R7YR77_CONA1|nr:uncharacterized protein W97_03540 [Coniosporium apollinis CBS 100218]EON64309.1 hypothetical protein W97_03540 [Coniosporium apollinis CBS 100218]
MTTSWGLRGWATTASPAFVQRLILSFKVLYIILIVCLNVVAGGGGSNLYTEEELPFTDEEVQERILGSKIVVVSEQAMLNTIYTLKACLLFMYQRITQGTPQQRLVKYLAIYVAVGWVATEIAFFTNCRPFNGYWAVPPPNPECTTLRRYAYVQAAFNLTSDVCMILIPVPMVLRLRLPLKQKIILAGVFSMGTFVIIAALLTKYFNLSDVWDTSYMLWYSREASVAVWVANLPMIWPLMREWLPFLRSMTGSKMSYNHDQHRTGYGKSDPRSRNISNHTGLGGPDVQLSDLKSNVNATTRNASTSSSNDDLRQGGFDFEVKKFGRRDRSPDSDERVLNQGQNWGTSKGLGDIRQETTIEVEHETVDLEKGCPSRRTSPGQIEWDNGRPIREVKIEGATDRSF